MVAFLKVNVLIKLCTYHLMQYAKETSVKDEGPDEAQTNSPHSVPYK